MTIQETWAGLHSSGDKTDARRQTIFELSDDQQLESVTGGQIRYYANGGTVGSSNGYNPVGTRPLIPNSNGHITEVSGTPVMHQGQYLSANQVPKAPRITTGVGSMKGIEMDR